MSEEEDECLHTTTDMSGGCLHCGMTSAEQLNERAIEPEWEDCPGCGCERRIGEKCHNHMRVIDGENTGPCPEDE